MVWHCQGVLLVMFHCLLEVCRCRGVLLVYRWPSPGLAQARGLSTEVGAEAEPLGQGSRAGRVQHVLLVA